MTAKLHTSTQNSNFTIIKLWFFSNAWTILIITIILLLHNIALLQSPSYFIDEFLYSARAWGVGEYGSIEIPPYYYSYDNPPFGWFILGIMGRLMPGLSWIERGRISISILFTIQILLVFSITKRLYNKLTANIALLILGIQPCLIHFQRMVLLDNVGIIFVLLAFFLMIYSQKTSFLSGLCFGCAILTKFYFAAFLPAFIGYSILLFKQNEENFLKKPKTLWIFFVRSIPFLFALCIPFLGLVIYSILNGTFISETQNSLVITTYIQFIRQSNISIWDPSSSFNGSIVYWGQNAPVFMALSFILCIFFLSIPLIKLFLFIVRKNKTLVQQKSNSFIPKNTKCIIIQQFLKQNSGKSFIIALFYLCFALFLSRGGVTFNFYFISLFPFAAMLISIFISMNFYSFLSIKQNSSSFSKKNNFHFNSKIIHLRNGLIGLFFLSFLLIPYSYSSIFADSTSPQYNTLNWIYENVSSDSFIASGSFFLPELRDSGYNHTHLIWRCFQSDLYMNETYFQDSWEAIDYLILNDYLIEIITTDSYYLEDGVLYGAYTHASLVYSSQGDDFSSQLYIYRINHETF